MDNLYNPVQAWAIYLGFALLVLARHVLLDDIVECPARYAGDAWPGIAAVASPDQPRF